MDFNINVFTEKSSILIDGGDRFGVSAVHWDLQEELVWVGNQGGHVTSYYGPTFHKYTSFQVHASEEIRQILSFNEGLLIVTSSSLRCQQKRGLPIFTHSSTSCENLQCIVQHNPTSALLGGHQSLLIEFDLITAKEISKIDIGEGGCAILRQHPRYICSGNVSGSVSLRDPRTLKEEHKFSAHTETLSDFDVHNNFLVTCGFSSRQGGIVSDRFLKVYDVRMLRALSPIPVVGEPFLLRFLPAFSSQLAVTSAMGQLQVVDAGTPSASAQQLLQIDTEGAMCMAMDISSSCQCLAVGDGGGYLHTFLTNEAATFNCFSRQTEFADPVEPLPVSIPFDDTSIPYTAVSCPTFKNQPMLSDLPHKFAKRGYRKVPPISPAVLANMRLVGTIGYAPCPPNHIPNQVSYGYEKRLNHSGKHHSSDSASHKDETNDFWKRYRHIEVRYTKCGLDENEIARHNKTPLCGMDNTLPNSYANCLLQVFYYLPEMRQSLRKHLCNREFCLACELSFFFHMLDVGRSQVQNGHPVTVQPANFLRAFRTLPEASAMGLLLSEMHPDIKRKYSLIRLATSWARFILQQLSTETSTKYRRQKSQDTSDDDLKASEQISSSASTSPTADNTSVDSPITKLFGAKQEQISRCTKCNNGSSKTSHILLSSLTLNELEGNSSFEQILERSLDVASSTPAWCDTCQKYQTTQQERRITSLPPILAISCSNEKEAGFRFWANQLFDEETSNLESAENVSSTGYHGTNKPCRYGLECSRPNCKFTHGIQFIRHIPTSTGITSKHWVPLKIRCISKPDGGVACASAEREDDGTSTVYSLVATVCWVDDSKMDAKHHDKRHLVSTVKVSPSYLPIEGENRDRSPEWYVFNDFAVNKVALEEVVSFFPDWKVPCLLFYSKLEDMKVLPDVKSVVPITADVFKEDKSLAQKSEGLQRISFLPLAADEMPGEGDLVAMDAEFVTLNQEEAELRSDGKSTTVRPSQMSVARISVIRGQGSMEGLPFIDDYIATQDQVVDYLTKFSGIQPGDLDIASSSKHLTTLKSTYLKLRFLVDNGVTFIGHGLQNDFRVINLLVPSSQVIDTVHLFHLPHHRMVSLRFLAWHFLSLKIQSITHDSVEDARTALRLYQRYLELKAKGDDFFHESLQELYNVGRRLQWTVPEGDEE